MVRRAWVPALLVLTAACGLAWAGSAGMAGEVLQALRDRSREDPGCPSVSIPAGDVVGHSAVNKFGHNGDVDAAEDVWSGGGTYVHPTQARVHTIVSTSTDDDSAGTGARAVQVYGLDENYLEVSEAVTLHGTLASVTSLTYTRMFRAKITAAGSGGVNAGAVTATANTDSTVSARIEIGDGQTLMAIYSVPAGKTAYLTGFYAAVTQDKANEYLDVELWFRGGIDNGESYTNVKHRFGLASSGGTPEHHDYHPCPAYVGPCDLWIRVASVSVGNMDVSAGFSLILVED